MGRCGRSQGAASAQVKIWARFAHESSGEKLMFCAARFALTNRSLHSSICEHQVTNPFVMKKCRLALLRHTRVCVSKSSGKEHPTYSSFLPLGFLAQAFLFVPRHTKVCAHKSRLVRVAILRVATTHLVHGVNTGPCTHTRIIRQDNIFIVFF